MSLQTSLVMQSAIIILYSENNSQRKIEAASIAQVKK
jgi:hypothetical protein